MAIDLDELDRACRNLLWLIAWQRSADHVAKADPALREHHERYLANFVNEATNHWEKTPLEKIGKYPIRTEDTALCSLYGDIIQILIEYSYEEKQATTDPQVTNLQKHLNKLSQTAIKNITKKISRWEKYLAKFQKTHAPVNATKVRLQWDRLQRQTPNKNWIVACGGLVEAAAALIAGLGIVGTRRLAILRKRYGQIICGCMIPAAHGGMLPRSMVQEYAMQVVRLPKDVIAAAVEKGGFGGGLLDETEPELLASQYDCGPLPKR